MISSVSHRRQKFGYSQNFSRIFSSVCRNSADRFNNNNNNNNDDDDNTNINNNNNYKNNENYKKFISEQEIGRTGHKRLFNVQPPE